MKYVLIYQHIQTEETDTIDCESNRNSHAHTYSTKNHIDQQLHTILFHTNSMACIYILWFHAFARMTFIVCVYGDRECTLVTDNVL